MSDQKEKQVLFIDDEKVPSMFGLPKDTPQAYRADEALEMWKTGKYDIMYLDYNILDKLGTDVLEECIKYKVPDFVYIITFNKPAVIFIKRICYRHRIPYEDLGTPWQSDESRIIRGQSG